MRRCYVALRFTEDKNLYDRLYWYLADGPISAGERMAAPVGPHDRVQFAIAERVIAAEDGHEPYPRELMKRAARAVDPPFGREFGGMHYDNRHITAYHVLVYAENVSEVPDMGAACTAYGLRYLPNCTKEEAIETLSRGHGVCVSGEEGRAVFDLLTAFMRGEKGAWEEVTRIAGKEGTCRILAALTGYSDRRE